MYNKNVDQRMDELFKIIDAEFIKIEHIFTKLENSVHLQAAKNGIAGSKEQLLKK